MSGTTRDGFLGGRLTIEQPARGYRAGADPVLMAAAAEVREGASVLELGCGVGTALLCLGHRVPGLILAGLEHDPDTAELARRNADANGQAIEIVTGDIGDMPAALKSRRFDLVMTNPPFFDRGRGTSAADDGRERGRGEATGLSDWLDAASRRLAPKGRLVLIQRIERLPEVLAALAPGLGDIAVRPLAGKPGRPAERFILTARKSARGPLSLLPPFVLHDMSGDNSAAAEAVLRDAASLEEALLTLR